MVYETYKTYLGSAILAFWSSLDDIICLDFCIFYKRFYKSWLKDEIKFKTKNGKFLSLGNIYLILRTTFYYGVFEYPKGSNNWYQGKHIPIIDKELFDLVQDNLKEHIIKTEGKEFAFTKLITCGLCGSGITADEKFKKQTNGNVHRYVYYGCTKHNDKSCKNPYINEEDLIEQLYCTPFFTHQPC